VFPVLTHLEGHTQIVTVHPALPPVGPDPDSGGQACRTALRQILEPFVEAHPEQCYSLVFEQRRRSATRRRAAAATRSGHE
jgi:hypothetical protein